MSMYMLSYPRVKRHAFSVDCHHTAKCRECYCNESLTGHRIICGEPLHCNAAPAPLLLVRSGFVWVTVNLRNIMNKGITIAVHANKMLSITWAILTLCRAGVLIGARQLLPSQSLNSLGCNAHAVDRLHNDVQGGGRAYYFTWPQLADYAVFLGLNNFDGLTDQSKLAYHSHAADEDTVIAMIAKYNSLISVRAPLSVLSMNMTHQQLLSVSAQHGLTFNHRIHIDSLRQALAKHHCGRCDLAVTLLKVVCGSHHIDTVPPIRKAVRKRQKTVIVPDKLAQNNVSLWPPEPQIDRSKEQIVREFCNRQDHMNIEEIACAVCAQLTLKFDAIKIDLSRYSDILFSPAAGSRKERKIISEPICELDGPLLANSDGYVCCDCHSLVIKRKTLMLSLANNMWLGDVPAQLQGLSYAETMLVTRVRHN